MDSDSIYTTNQPDIVEHARKCYIDYPTIVNLIPKEKNIYNNIPKDYARADIVLANSQLGIGESSNLAQIALTYTYNFDDPKYNDAAMILAVVAQICVDSSKRKFDLDTTNEIRYIKSQLDIEKNGLPNFWQITKKDKRKARTNEQRKQMRRNNKEKIEKRINPSLVCPMNYMYGLNLSKYRSDIKTIPIEQFFATVDIQKPRKKSEKIEKMIEKYELAVTDAEAAQDTDWYDGTNLLLMENFEELINDIRKIGITKNYAGLMLWLINRAFRIPEQTKNIKSKINANKPVLMKVLYEVNPEAFLSCFTKVPQLNKLESA